MATEGSRSSGSAAPHSFIGSVISLTSKSDIRYEGILYNINTDESSIGLRVVRSYGTEGRNKDGPQIPPCDRVYDYILFRGSDIKDLQVKSSPATQTSSPVNSDPAIIQSQNPRPATASTSLPNAVVSSTTITSAQTSRVGQTASNIQNGAPLHQPVGENVGKWGPSLSSASGMPMYWQGYFGSSSGQLSHQNQQPFLRPPGLSMPPLLQQQTNHYLQQQMPPLQLPSYLQQQAPSSLQPQMPSSLKPQLHASSLQTQMPSSLLQQIPSSLLQQIPFSPQQMQPFLQDQQQLPSMNQQQLPSMNQQLLPSMNQQLLPSMNQQQLPSMNQQQLPSMNQQQLPSMNQPLHYSRLSIPNENSNSPAPLSLLTLGASSGPSGTLTSMSSSTSILPSNLPPAFQVHPSSLHQPLHYSSLSIPNENSTLPAPPSLFTLGASSEPSGTLTSMSSSISTLPSNLPPAFPLLPVISLAIDAASSSVTSKAPIAAPVPTIKTPVTSLSPATSLLSSDLDGNTLLQPLCSKPVTMTSPTAQQNASMTQPMPSDVGAGNSISPQAPIPALLTPGHSLKSSSISSATPSQTVHKDVEVVRVSSSPAVVSDEPDKKPPVLPLIMPTRPLHKQNGAPIWTYNGHRGRGRGRGRVNSRPLTTFSEEFDFTAMNEKFKKDEVWGHLGKSSKLYNHQEGGKHGDEDFAQLEAADLPKIDIKAVYIKDDFFDSLSSSTQDQESNHGKHRFSEQRKLDTETFGEFSRYRGGRGGHGSGRGNYKGFLNGRGYGRGGYGYGRFRGRGGPNRVS